MRITYEEITAQQALVWLLQASELDPSDQQDRLDDLHMLARARLRRAFERLTLMAQVAEGLSVGVERLAYRSQAVELRHVREAYAQRLAQERADSLARAELVIEGNHPWLDLSALLEFYGLDTSFVWTPETLAPYVDASLQADQE